MKNILKLMVIGLILFSSCENEADVKSDLEKLKQQRSELMEDIRNKSDLISDKKIEISNLDEKLKELKIYESGKTPKYILKLKLSQSHFTLDLEQHMKDALNDIEFEMPVDRDFYNSIRVGTKIVDEFRVGSFILSGSIGDWDMKVVGKEIRK